MHFPSFLLVATTAASTLVSARVDRIPSVHRQFARSANLERREAHAEPEPYRLFAKPNGDAGSPFGKRDEASFAKIGDAVSEVATAMKLDVPPPVVQLAAVNTSSKHHQKKKNQVCRKKTKEEKLESKRRAAAAKEKKAKSESHSKSAPKEQQLNVDVKAKSSHAASNKSSSSKTNDNSESSSGGKVANIAGIVKPAVSLIGFHSDNCGPSDATDEFPNGSEAWLTCGISKSNPNSKWTPPQGVTLDKLTTVTIEHALATNSVWEPCKRFIPLFEKVGAEENLPPILLASFALQESTCNPDTQGDNGGAFGLMQITQDKCNGMGAAGCSDPEYNVRTAAKYFNTELANRGGRFLEALGAYNGWFVGMSYADATAAAHGECCVCQQNLDYGFQMTGGWLMGRTGYEMGSFQNLRVCKD